MQVSYSVREVFCTHPKIWDIIKRQMMMDLSLCAFDCEEDIRCQICREMFLECVSNVAVVEEMSFL